MTTYVPYSQLAPQTTDLRALKLELDRVRAEYGPGASQGYEAYQRYSREAARQGRPLDGLRRFSTNESERFFAQVIPGPDGHHYWDGGKYFRRNDGKYRIPARYWWEREHGPIGTNTLRLHATCGDQACISPEHQELRHMSAQRYSDDEILGGLQVYALRHDGLAPSKEQWNAASGRPWASVIATRFGSWPKAILAAGLTPLYGERRNASPERCRESVQLAHRMLGRWPSTWDIQRREVRAALRRAELPSSVYAIKVHLGDDWETVLRNAGKP